MQTTLFALHEHLREHMLVGFVAERPHPQRTSCKIDPGARSTRVRTGLNLPSTVSFLRCLDQAYLAGQIDHVHKRGLANVHDVCVLSRH